MTTIQTNGRDVYRETMARVCTPVTIVTALDGNRPHGTTVSAFTALSASPPMIMVALDERSDLLQIVRETGRFGVHALSQEQGALAMRFATKGQDKFESVPWTLEHQVPRLTQCSAFLACDVDRLVVGGDHVVAFAHVVSADHSEAPPLTYYMRSFGTHAHAG
ncbi:flavin reductase family protein [Gordonia terrae]